MEEREEQQTTLCACCERNSLQNGIELACGHWICQNCMSRQIEDSVENEKASLVKCPVELCVHLLEPSEIQTVVSDELFMSYLDACLRGFIAEDDNLLSCPNPDCSSFMSFVELDKSEILTLQSNDITQTGEDGRALSRHAWIHFNRYRIRCRECQEDFCSQCRLLPYHLGLDCEEYKEYRKAKKCRFCQASLTLSQLAPPSSYPALQNCCRSEECLSIREISCEKTLPCSHFCGGGRGESQCLPCLEEECLSSTQLDPPISQNKYDFCPICWVSQLSEEPSILLSCGHIVHLRCAQKIYKTRWNTPHIHFSFRNCPLCQVPMSHELLDEYSQPVEDLLQQTVEVGLAVLDAEKNMTDESILADSSSEFYGQKEKYVLSKMSFYLCSKCDTPFYGGRMDCMAGLREQEMTFEQLTCSACRSKGGRVSCDNSNHQDFWIYKCRYCCSPAKWFCFGNTHFCNSCHERAGDFANVDVSLLPQCKGPLHCPLGVEHPPNGKEFLLTCQLCQEEHDRDPEVTKRVKRFETRQKVKRNIKMVFCSILHLINWMILLLSAVYPLFPLERDASVIFTSIFEIAVKLTPLLVGISVFFYQIVFCTFQRGRLRRPLRWSMIVPYFVVVILMYLTGSITFSFLLLFRVVMLFVYIARLGVVCRGISLFIRGRWGKSLVLAGSTLIVELLRYYFSLPINSAIFMIPTSIPFIVILFTYDTMYLRVKFYRVCQIPLLHELTFIQPLQFKFGMFFRVLCCLALFFECVIIFVGACFHSALYLFALLLRCSFLSCYFIHSFGALMGSRHLVSRLSFLIFSLLCTLAVECCCYYFSITWISFLSHCLRGLLTATNG